MFFIIPKMFGVHNFRGCHPALLNYTQPPARRIVMYICGKSNALGQYEHVHSRWFSENFSFRKVCYRRLY